MGVERDSPNEVEDGRPRMDHALNKGPAFFVPPFSYAALYLLQISACYFPLFAFFIHHRHRLVKQGPGSCTRKLYPEYDDETGCSYVIEKSSDKLKPNSSEVKYAYSLKGQFKIEVILAQNFNLQGNKVPSDVSLKIK